MTETQPVVIIGAGHNGLVCAAYLARAGHQVQVLEAREEIGGAASTDEFAAGYKVSGIAHILQSLSAQVCKDLDLVAAGLKMGPPIDTIALDRQGRHLTLGNRMVAGEGLSSEDIKAYTGFKKEFLAYARALKPLTMNKPPRLKDMDLKDLTTLARLGWGLRFGLGASSMREFLRVGGINIHDVLNETFASERLKGAIAADAVIGHHMGPRTPTTVLTYLHRLQGENECPQNLPPGGMGQVSNAIVAAARKQGVTIRTASKVSQILVGNGRATGVRLESGEQIQAAIVISNAGAKTTFLDLIGTAELDARFAHRVDKIRSRGDVAKLHLGLRGLPVVKGLSTGQLGQRLLIAPDMNYVEHAFNHSKYGEYSNRPVLEITIPSIADPSLAPAGHQVMSIAACYAPYSLKKGWDQEGSAFAEKVTSLIGEYAPGFAELVVASELLTPADIESQYGIEGGHWHHGEMSIDQSFMMRPVPGAAQYDTPIDGLFLCGAAAHPGGGVSGIPGHNAAQRILAMGALK